MSSRKGNGGKKMEGYKRNKVQLIGKKYAEQSTNKCIPKCSIENQKLRIKDKN
jgi:hypothetical protein